jgi:hypothetical protein
LVFTLEIIKEETTMKINIPALALHVKSTKYFLELTNVMKAGFLLYILRT